MMQRGFSIPEITLALGLVAGVSLVTMKLVETNARNQNRLKASAEIQKTVSLLKVALNDPIRCRTILRDQLVPTVADSSLPGAALGTNPGSQAGLFQEIRDGGGTSLKELLRPNTAYSSFRTSTITLRRISGAPSDTAELILNFANETDSNMRNDGSHLSADKVSRIVIPLIAKLNGSGVLTDCTPSISDVDDSAREKFCLSLGNLAEWDNPPGSRTCKFKTHQCSYGFVPTIHQLDGSLVCVPLRDQINPDLLFDESPCTMTSTNSNLRIIEVGGRLKLECN